MNVEADPLVLDATVLSNFASSNSISWLTTVFAAPVTAPIVNRELRHGIEHDYEFLQSALSAIENDEISVHYSAADGVTPTKFPELFDVLDRGEAQALGIAELLDGAIATDDLPARRLAVERDVPKTGSVGLLVAGVLRDELSIETADEWLDTWQTESDYHRPVESVTEALPDDIE